jgi:hypothetical protein
MRPRRGSLFKRRLAQVNPFRVDQLNGIVQQLQTIFELGCRGENPFPTEQRANQLVPPSRANRDDRGKIVITCPQDVEIRERCRIVSRIVWRQVKLGWMIVNQKPVANTAALQLRELDHHPRFITFESRDLTSGRIEQIGTLEREIDNRRFDLVWTQSIRGKSSESSITHRGERDT